MLDSLKVPYEEDETLGLKVMIGLCNWDWGIRLLFAHDNFVRYLTERVGVSPNSVLHLKYELVTKAIQNPQQLISNDVMIKLTEYKKGGVFGENVKG